MRARELLSFGFRILAAAIALIGVTAALWVWSFAREAVRVEGTVVGFDMVRSELPLLRSDESAGRLYYPIIEYRVAGGEERRVTGRTGAARPALQPGDSVSVLIGADRQDARLDSLMDVWGAPIVLGGLALVFLVISFLAPLGFRSAEEVSEDREQP